MLKNTKSNCKKYQKGIEEIGDRFSLKKSGKRFMRNLRRPLFEKF